MAFFRQSFKSNEELVQYLCKKQKILTHKAAVNAMLVVDRADFCDEKVAYHDCPQYLSHGATISAPHMHAHALNDLASNLLPGMKALDIGSGSGYLAVAMAHMVGGKGKVIGIEHIKELFECSLKNIAKSHGQLLQSGQLEMHCGDGRQGFAKEAPFDAIHVGAAAQPSVADVLSKQLKIGGRMVIPVEVKGGDQIFREYVMNEDGKVTFTNRVQVRYVPLTSEAKQRNQHK